MPASRLKQFGWQVFEQQQKKVCPCFALFFVWFDVAPPQKSTERRPDRKKSFSIFSKPKTNNYLLFNGTNSILASVRLRGTCSVTYLTLESLLAKAPDEVLAMRAKSGLLEEAGQEFVVLHIENVLLLQRSLASACSEATFESETPTTASATTIVGRRLGSDGSIVLHVGVVAH